VRGNPALRRKYQAVLAYLGLTLTLVGAVILFPLLVLPARPQECPQALGFLVPGLASCAAGLVSFLLLRPRQIAMSFQEGGVLVLLSWILACLLGAVPFMLVERMNFTPALFESVSGWTTTGLSVVDVTKARSMTLLFRSTMQLVGGAGFAIIMMATLIGAAGTGVSGAEGRTDQLVPQVRQSARIVLTLYLGYTLVGTMAYALAGLSPFDAINHAFAAVSTGGFSTRVDSIGHWDSAAVEAVSLALMLFGNLNFLTAYLIFKGRFRMAARSGEVRLVAILAPMGCLALFIFVSHGLYTALDKAIRVCVFETVTALTTTGFSTVSYPVPYRDWGTLGIFLLILLMVIGGGTCSTAGGLKQYRVFLVTKAVFWEIRKALLPRSAIIDQYVWRGEERYYLSDQHVRQVAVFSCLYLAALAVGTLVLAAHGYQLHEALFEYASAQGTVGLSLGVTTAAAPRLVLWTEMAGMFFGRLEFFVIFISVAKLVGDIPSLLRRPDRN
jgi:trk system potassium uptake protein TrkH